LNSAKPAGVSKRSSMVPAARRGARARRRRGAAALTAGKPLQRAAGGGRLHRRGATRRRGCTRTRQRSRSPHATTAWAAPAHAARTSEGGGVWPRRAKVPIRARWSLFFRQRDAEAERTNTTARVASHAAGAHAQRAQRRSSGAMRLYSSTSVPAHELTRRKRPRGAHTQRHTEQTGARQRVCSMHACMRSPRVCAHVPIRTITR
jgi:hypothetical protein